MSRQGFYLFCFFAVMFTLLYWTRPEAEQVKDRVTPQPVPAPTPPASTWDQDLFQLMLAIEQVESGGNTAAVNHAERALGSLQITPIMVKDVNRILGQDRYRHEDMHERQAAEQVFFIYSNHYSHGQPMEVVARRWNGGPTGDRKQATLPYWNKVNAILNKDHSDVGD